MAAILALSVPWALFQVYQSNHADQAAKATDDQSKARQQVFEICQQQPGAVAANCFAQAHQTYPEDQRSEYDLEAQQDMAEWALFSAVIGAFGALASLGAMIGLFITLRDQREQFAAERRPWVQIKKFELRRTSWSTDGLVFHYEAELQNVGQSPAVEVFADCDAFCDLDFDEPVRLQSAMREKWRASSHVESGAIFPNDSFTKAGSIKIGYDEVVAIWDRRNSNSPEAERRRIVDLHPKIFGVVRYRGRHSGETHTTTFMYYVTDAPELDDPFLGKMPVSLDIERAAMRPIRMVKFYKGWDAD